MYRIDRALGAGNRELKSHLHGYKGPGGSLCPGRQPASAALQQREQEDQQTHQSPMTRRMVNQCSCRAEGDCSAACLDQGSCPLNENGSSCSEQQDGLPPSGSGGRHCRIRTSPCAVWAKQGCGADPWLRTGLDVKGTEMQVAGSTGRQGPQT